MSILDDKSHDSQKTVSILLVNKGLEIDVLSIDHNVTAISHVEVMAGGPKKASELIQQHLKNENTLKILGASSLKNPENNHHYIENPDVKVKGASSVASTVSSCNKSDSVASISSISQKWARSPTIYIARDYSEGMNEAFKTKYPKQLLGYVSKPQWKNTIHVINELLRKGERINGWTVLETVLEAVTFHLYGLIVPSRKELFLDELVTFIEHENRIVYNPKRVHLSNPRQNGLRHLEIVFLDRKFD